MTTKSRKQLKNNFDQKRQINRNNDWVRQAGSLVVRYAVHAQLTPEAEELAHTAAAHLALAIEALRPFYAAVHLTTVNDDNLPLYLKQKTLDGLTQNQRQVLLASCKREAETIMLGMNTQLEYIKGLHQSMRDAGQPMLNVLHRELFELQGGVLPAPTE